MLDKSWPPPVRNAPTVECLSVSQQDEVCPWTLQAGFVTSPMILQADPGPVFRTRKCVMWKLEAPGPHSPRMDFEVKQEASCEIFAVFV